MKISNLGKGALVGLGLSCGVASTPLIKVKRTMAPGVPPPPPTTFIDGTPVATLACDNCDVYIPITSVVTNGPTTPPTPPTPPTTPTQGNGNAGTILAIVGAVGATAATVAGVLFCRRHKAHKANQDNAQDIVININNSVNPDQNNNLDREADIVEIQASQSNVLGVEQDTFDQLPPSYEDVCNMTQNIVLDNIRDVKGKHVSSCHIYTTSAMNDMGDVCDIEANTSINKLQNIINSLKDIKGKNEDTRSIEQDIADIVNYYEG